MRLGSFIEGCHPVCHLSRSSHELPFLRQMLGSWFNRCVIEVQTCRARPLCHSPFAQHIDHGCREEEDHAQEGQHGYQGCLASSSSWFFLLFVILLFLICFSLRPSFQTKARRDNGGLPVLGELLVQGQCSRWKSGLLGALNQGRGACVWRCPLCGLGDPGTGLRQKFLVVEILPMTGPTLFALKAFHYFADPLVLASPTHALGPQLEPDKEWTAVELFQMFSDMIQSTRWYLGTRTNCTITGTTSSDTALVTFAWQQR